jgi:two-component system sporulation sensor kinase A
MNSSQTISFKEKNLLLESYLSENLSRNKTLFFSNQNALYVLDLEGNFVQTNSACQKLSGYSEEELRKKSFNILLPPEDVDKIHSYFNRAIMGEFQNYDCKFLNQMNQVIHINIMNIPISVQDEIVGIYGVARDITEFKNFEGLEAEKEIQHREETYRDLVEHSPDAVMIARDYEILFINETGRKLLGASSKEEILKKTIKDLLHPDYLEVALKRMKIVRNGSPTNFIEYKLICLDGSVIEAEIMGIPTIYQNKPARHIIIRDVQEKKKTQELIINSEKLATAGKLAAGIAHEVRNPLTAIKGFHQLMQTEHGSNKKYYEIINSEINRIELILNELLVLSKPQELKVEAVELIKLVEDVKTLIDTEALMNGVQIHTFYDYEALTIQCDKNQLKQVFINILKNSIEAISGNGIIKVEVKNHGPNKVKLLFNDDGCGIPESLLKRIGEPFFTTKENGTGLGIMISKQIVDNHNGQFHIWSDKEGTLIEIILPIPNIF